MEDENGNTIFDSEELSISDSFVNYPTIDRMYKIEEVKSRLFAHSYYISKYYTMLPTDSFLIDDLDSFIEESKIPKSIKVIDENNQEYIDKQTGIKKYRILLDQVDQDVYEERSNRPFKIVVLFADPHPINLQLVYDKVALSSTESISSIVPQYKENINSITIFNKSLEESIVSDNSMRNKKIFSKKSISFRNNIINNNSLTDGFEVVVPKKAIADNRTYETFNWRMITKVLRKVDVSSVSAEEEIDSESNLKQKVINCAVLCTSAQRDQMNASLNYESANPYVFYRLQQSPFNIGKYSYTNPIGSGVSSSALYWLVSIDEVSNQQLALFDVLAWSPSSSITAVHGEKIKYFIQNTQGTIILDLSRSSGAENIDPSLTISSEEFDLFNWTYNTSSVFLNENSNGAWPISGSVFEDLTLDGVKHNIYSIFGRNNIGALNLGISNYKKVKEFTGQIANENIVLKNSTGNPIFVGFGYKNSADALLRGNILASTTSFLKYCNDVYQPSALFDISTANSAGISIVQEPFIASSVIERTNEAAVQCSIGGSYI